MHRILLPAICLLLIPGCTPPAGHLFFADYDFSLVKVERLERGLRLLGPQDMDTLSTNTQYQFQFDDDLVVALCSVNTSGIGFSLQNKTDHSMKVLWDEAAFVDEYGRCHRIMHSGVKYTDKEMAQPASVIVRKGIIEDKIFPTDYIYWSEGSQYSAGRWEKKPLFLDMAYRGLGPSSFPPRMSFAEFDSMTKSKIGNVVQVLLPLQIEDVIDNYIFSFRIDSVKVHQ